MDFGLASAATDNLYKFLFLGGLTLLVFSLVKPYEQKSMVDSKVTELQIDTLVLSRDLNEINKRIEVLESEKPELFKKVIILGRKKSELKKTDPDFQKVVSEFESLKKEYSSNCKSVLKDITKAKSLENSMHLKKKVLRIQMIDLKKKKEFFYVLSGFGILLTIIGGVLWYYKTQRHSDKIIKDQAN